MDISFWFRIQSFLCLKDRLKPVNKAWIKALRLSTEYKLFAKYKDSSVLLRKAARTGNKALLESFSDIDFGNKLHLFAESGSRNLVYRCISKGDDVWNVAMNAATKKRHRHLIDLFLALGANSRESIMYYSARSEDKDIINFFIARDSRYWNGGLAGASSRGNRELVYYFISREANDWNWSLFESCRRGGDISLAKLSIALGAGNLNDALGGSVKYKHLVYYLISRGANNWSSLLRFAIETKTRFFMRFSIALWSTAWDSTTHEAFFVKDKDLIYLLISLGIGQTIYLNDLDEKTLDLFVALGMKREKNEKKERNKG